MSENIIVESEKRLNSLQSSIETATGESYNDLTEAVKVAIKQAERLKWYETYITALSFERSTDIERVDFYIDKPLLKHNSMFRNTSKLRFVVGVNTKYSSDVSYMFSYSGIVTIQEPLDFSSITNMQYGYAFSQANSLVDARIVPETIKVSFLFTSKVLSAESVQSIAYGLAYVTKAMTLQIPKEVVVTEELKTLITEKGWTLVQN